MDLPDNVKINISGIPMDIYSKIAVGLIIIGSLFISIDFTSAQSIDIKPATIVSTNPENNTRGVDINIPISITFAEDLDPSTITPDTLYLSSLDNYEGLIIPGRIEYDADSKTVYFFPDEELFYSTNYTVTIEGGIKTLSGSTLEPGYFWGFTTKNSFAGCGGS